MSFRKRPIEQEKETIRKMVNLYCRHKHGSKQDPCGHCRELLAYAGKRLDLCKFGDRKPTCEKCPVHCYRPDMRERVREVMRYAGPRMILYHPLDALRHMMKNKAKGPVQGNP